MLIGWVFLLYRYAVLEYHLLKNGAAFGTHLIATIFISLVAITYTSVCGLLLKLNSFLYRKIR